MALPTADKGYFTVTALSFTPSVAAMGETVQFSVTIKNSSGKAISSCYIRMAGDYPSTDAPSGVGEVPGYVYLHGGPSFAMASISWANGSSKTFTGSFTWTKGFYALDDSSYVLSPSSANLRLSIVTGTDFDDGTNYDNIRKLCGSSGEYLHLLSKRDNPRVTLDMWRTPDDESSSVATTIKLTSDVSSSVFQNRGYSAKLYYSSVNNSPTTSDSTTTLNATIAQMLTGISGSTSAVTAKFSNGSDWYFLLVVSNGYESNSATCSIPRAFANLHLSGCSTGGACFGGFSSSTENNPKLESYYPVYLYGGIAKVGGSSDLLPSLGVQTGNSAAQSVSSSGSVTVSVTFPKPYTAAPVVVANIASTSTSYYLGRCNVVIESVDATGFTARIANGGSGTLSIGFNWVAFGNLAAEGTPITVTRPQGAMTSNSSLSCEASASSTYSSSYPAWRAFDASAATSWASSASESAPWIQLKMDVALANIQVSVYSRSQNASAGNHNPTAGTVQGSNDGSSWTQIGSYSGWTAKNDGTLLGTIACNNETAYKYVRLNITSRAGSEYAAIGYISIRGEI